jgi:hypothetical protein
MESGIKMSKSNEINLLNRIQAAFETRNRPVVFTDSSELTATELADLETVIQLEWNEVTCTDWENYFDVISWFSPEAFCYYLAGIYKASIVEKQPNLIVITNIIGMLDRSPNIEWWDDFFLKRWPLLTQKECEATQEWILWLASFESLSVDLDSLERALQTIDLLITQKNKDS